jgi:hypothetical protein
LGGGQKWRGGYQEEKRGVLGVVAVGLGKLERESEGYIGERRSGDASAVELKPSCIDADILGDAGGFGCGQLGMD